MQIRKPPTRKPQTEAVKYKGNSGKRGLVKAVMDAGYSKRVGEKAVDAVIAAWKRVLKNHEIVEVPLGVLKVKKTPKNLYRRRHAGFRTNHKGERRLYSWTVYNDAYRVLWRVPEEQWRELLQQANRDAEVTQVSPGPMENERVLPPVGNVSVPATTSIGSPVVWLAPVRRGVPSRTDAFRTRTTRKSRT